MADREEDSNSDPVTSIDRPKTDPTSAVSDVQAQEEEEMEQKIINEGKSLPRLPHCAQADRANRIQNMEEEHAISLRLNPQHSSRLANPYYAMAT